MSERFIINNDGTVTDTSTGLTWQQATAGPMAWEAAQKYCAKLELAGGGWRLPTVQELQSIVDYTRQVPAIDTAAFPDTMSRYYWSCTTYALIPRARGACTSAMATSTTTISRATMMCVPCVAEVSCEHKD